MESNQNNQEFKKALTPLMLWGLGVGYVISGMYFGWNLGLKEGGTLGLAVATFFIIILYVTFTFSYSELACAIPKAGGVFDYANRALGKDWGFISGMAQNIEFIFAPPAIAFAIGAYFNLFFKDVPVFEIAIVAYVLFTVVNILGVKIAALFELVITLLAVIELLIFAGITLPHFQVENLTHNALPNGWGGAFAAIPFAIWFFLGIEGIANVAEETINPQKNIIKGFGSSIITLVVLCVIVFVAAVGVGGWESIVFNADGSASDSPLPLAMAQVVGENSFLFHMLLTIGLFGLIASFHGLMLAGGRTTYEFAKVGYAPKLIGRLSPKFKTPANALIVNTIFGIGILYSGKTTEIITIAVFGALTLYIVAMFALLALRKKEPDMVRPFKVPFYPLSPILAICIGIFSIVAMTYYNFTLAMYYYGILIVSYLGFKLFYKHPEQS